MVQLRSEVRPQNMVRLQSMVRRTNVITGTNGLRQVTVCCNIVRVPSTGRSAAAVPQQVPSARVRGPWQGGVHCDDGDIDDACPIKQFVVPY